MTKPSLKSVLAAGTVAFALAWAAPVAVQAQSQPAQQQMQPGQVTEDDLRSYAAAAVEVQRIGQDYQPRIQAAEDDQASMALREQAQQEMVEAVRQEGLTVEQYNEIYQLAQADPNVREQILGYMQQAE